MTVKILGAGLSGLTAAITLARARRKVSVYEKGTKPSSRIIWGLQILKNYEDPEDVIEKIRRKFKISIRHYCKIKAFTIFSPSLKKCEIYSTSRPMYYIIERGFLSRSSLDIQLFKEAKKLGVSFYFNAHKKDADIIARGPTRMDAIGAVASFEAPTRKNEILLFYDSRYAPAGYLYLFRWGRKIEVGLAAPALNVPQLPQKLLTKALKKNKILCEYLKECKLVDRPRFVYCDVDIPFTAYRNGKYYVGEAAGFLHASKGFGMYYAIASGYLAARSIITGENYDELWKREFKHELVEGFKKRIIWQRMRDKDYDKMIEEFGPRLSVEEYLEKKRKKTWKHHLIDILYPYYLMKWKLFRKL